MPILDVERAASVVVIKRSMSPGYVGIANPLSTDPRTGLPFADAKQALADISLAVKQYVHVRAGDRTTQQSGRVMTTCPDHELAVVGPARSPRPARCSPLIRAPPAAWWRLRTRYDNFIGGHGVAPKDGAYAEDLAPATGLPFAEYTRSTVDDVDLAVAAATRAFPGWAATSTTDRAAVLTAIADTMQEHLGDIVMALGT